MPTQGLLPTQGLRLTEPEWNDPWPQWQNVTQNVTHAGYTWTPAITVNAATIDNATWRMWTGSSSITFTGVWQYWNEGGELRGRCVPAVDPALEEARAQALTERQDLRRAARTRARALLFTLLTPEQRHELEEKRRFHVRGSRGRCYRITAHGQSGNVQLLNDAGTPVAQLCAHPVGNLPDPDAWLAQKLAIELDEDGFLRTANVHWGRLPAGVVGRFGLIAA